MRLFKCISSSTVTLHLKTHDQLKRYVSSSTVYIPQTQWWPRDRVTPIDGPVQERMSGI